MTRIPQSAAVTDKLKSMQQWATACVLVLAPLFFGSVDQFWIAILLVTLSFTTILGVSVPLNIVQARVVWAVLIDLHNRCGNPGRSAAACCSGRSDLAAGQ